MRDNSFLKYAFSIKTRLGVVVNNLLIQGRDECEAQHKLRQIYHKCQILECVCRQDVARGSMGKVESARKRIAVE